MSGNTQRVNSHRIVGRDLNNQIAAEGQSRVLALQPLPLCQHKLLALYCDCAVGSKVSAANDREQHVSRLRIEGHTSKIAVNVGHHLDVLAHVCKAQGADKGAVVGAGLLRHQV